MEGFVLPDCFSFLRLGSPRTPTRCPNLQLPGLEESCAIARKHPCNLAARALVVGARLLPISCRIVGDNLRSTGSRNGVQNAKKLRIELEALGPAFIKLGQAMASRQDILSPAAAAELRKLCDQVIPMTLEEARGLLHDELGSRSPALEGEAVAAASLGQVYKIRVGGEDFAVKIQRPGLADRLAVDVVIILNIVGSCQRMYRRFAASTVDLVQVVQHWAQTMWYELDYKREAQSMEYMHKRLVGHVSGLVIPRVHWPLSSLRVLTTQWIDGARLTDALASVLPKHITVGVNAFTTMVLDIGLVHADPHSGNVIITPKGDVCLLDFGMVVEVPPSHRTAWARCIYSLICKDHARTLESLIDIGIFPQDCPKERILEVMPKIWTELVDAGSDIEKRKRAVQECFSECMILVREFEFDLPDYYLALLRAMITLEGIAIAADMEFDIFKAVLPCIMRFLAEEGKKEAVSQARKLRSTLSCPGCRRADHLRPSRSKMHCALGLFGAVGLGAIAYSATKA